MKELFLEDDYKEIATDSQDLNKNTSASQNHAAAAIDSPVKTEIMQGDDAKGDKVPGKSTNENVLSDDLDMECNDVENDTGGNLIGADVHEDVDDVDHEEITIDPKTYCKLGHFHLLLEDYGKGKK